MTFDEFSDIFCHRKNPYAIQQKSGNYYPSTHECMKDFIKENKIPTQVTEEVLKKHFSGELTIGAYSISENGTCRYICVDIDDKKMFQIVEKRLLELKIPFLREQTGGRGIHFWIIFKTPLKADHVHKFGQRLREYLRGELEEEGFTKFQIEVFPKQEGLKNSDPGSLVKVPLGAHQKYGNKSHFKVPIKELEIEYFNPGSVVIPEPRKKKIKPSAGKSRMPCTEKMMAGCSEGDGRDETALRLAVRFWRAGIPKEDALELLENFNANCEPPLKDNVLRKKLDQGYKGYSLGCNSDIMAQYCDSSCFLYDKVKRVSYKEDELIPEKGFLDYYLKYNKNNDHPKVFHLMIGLFLISSIVKNHVWADPFGTEPVYPNLYVLFTAPSGHRKTASTNVGKNLLVNFDDSLLLPDSIASYEAYLACFVHQPQATFIISEFSRFMRRLNREGMGGVKDILTEIYDCPPSHRIYSKGEQYSRIENPCYNIIAGCPPAYLEANTRPEDWQEGFMGRFIVLNAVRKTLKGISPRTAEEEEMKKNIIKWFSKLEKLRGVYDFSEVQDDLNEAIKKYSYSKDELLMGFYERATNYLIKFSILYQIALGGDNKITIESFTYAKKLFSYIEQTYSSMMNELSLTRESKDINKVFRLIRDSKEFGISHTILMQGCGFYKNKFASIIGTLEEQGRIRIEKYGNTKKGQRYFERMKEE